MCHHWFHHHGRTYHTVTAHGTSRHTWHVRGTVTSVVTRMYHGCAEPRLQRPSGTLPTFDIECRTFYIGICRYCNWNVRTFDIEIRYYTRYRMLWNSISSALNLENIDIEGRNIQYSSSTISKNCRHRSIKDRYRLIMISKKRRYGSSKLRYRSSKLWYRYIPISKISRYR